MMVCTLINPSLFVKVPNFFKRIHIYTSYIFYRYNNSAFPTAFMRTSTCNIDETQLGTYMYSIRDLIYNDDKILNIVLQKKAISTQSEKMFIL